MAAAAEYYRPESTQLAWHRRLLRAVEQHINCNGCSTERQIRNPHNDTELYNMTHLEAFAYDSAGLPIMYGVCLQRQHLDPLHQSKRFRVLNGDRPFAYRYEMKFIRK